MTPSDQDHQTEQQPVTGACCPLTSAMLEHPELMMKHLQARADAGNDLAGFMLRTQFADDKGTLRNEEEVLAAFRERAAQGDKMMQFMMGMMAHVQNDFEAALEMFTLAAGQGMVHAQKSLADMYAKGDGIAQNLPKAVEWYRKAAEQGDRGAQTMLGYYLLKGEGVENPVEGAQWFLKAAEQGDAYAQYAMGILYSNGNGVEQNQAKTVEWLRRAAEQGRLDAQLDLGMEIMQQDPPDYAEAAKWFLAVAEQGNAFAQKMTGMFYLNGDGVEKDMEKAAEWFHKAEKQEIADRQRELMEHYADESDDTEDDPTNTSYWLKIAAEQDDPDAAYELGEAYMAGNGVTQDYSLAAEWFLRADTLGFEGAMDRYRECLAASRAEATS